MIQTPFTAKFSDAKYYFQDQIEAIFHLKIIPLKIILSRPLHVIF